ncbi:MAG: hypothetical protein JJT99_12810 [Rhodobacteraceae bacterium]|nr:hypothetical protein [Paracoccaceae bacterium]
MLARLANWFLNHDPRHAAPVQPRRAAHSTAPPKPASGKPPHKLARRIRRLRNKLKYSLKRLELVERHVQLHREHIAQLNTHAQRLEEMLHQTGHPDIAEIALFLPAQPYDNPAPTGTPYVKTYKPHKHITALNSAQALRLESACLLSLTAGGDGAQHFPCVHKVDPQTNLLLISDCGLSLKAREMRLPISKRAYFAQAERIAEQLDHCGIWHLDLMNTGQNLCFSEDGIMRLIDFDIAYHPDLPVMSGSIAARLEKARARYTTPGALLRKHAAQLYKQCK